MADEHSTQSPTNIADVVAYLDNCSDVFGQLAAIFKAIEAAAPQHSDLQKLASAGHYLASDVEDSSDCFSEQLTRNGVDGLILKTAPASAA